MSKGLIPYIILFFLMFYFFFSEYNPEPKVITYSSLERQMVEAFVDTLRKYDVYYDVVTLMDCPIFRVDIATLNSVQLEAVKRLDESFPGAILFTLDF